MAPLIEHEILCRLLSGPVGPRLPQIAITETPSNKIARAIARMKESFTRPLRIEDLAERVGMSVSSLRHHFKAITTMTPMQYQKQLRLLHEARRLMLMEASTSAQPATPWDIKAPRSSVANTAGDMGCPPRATLPVWARLTSLRSVTPRRLLARLRTTQRR